jgi:hypothetical protein
MRREALEAPKRYQREHRQSLHLRLACSFDELPERGCAAGHERAHRDATGDEIAERHHGADFFDSEIGKLFFEALPIALKEYPGQGSVCVRKGAIRWEVPALDFWLERFVMQMCINQARPRGDPRLDHSDDTAGPQTARGFPEKSRDIGYVVQNVGHDDRSKVARREWETTGISDKLDTRALEDF